MGEAQGFTFLDGLQAVIRFSFMAREIEETGTPTLAEALAALGRASQRAGASIDNFSDTLKLIQAGFEEIRAARETDRKKEMARAWAEFIAN